MKAQAPWPPLAEVRLVGIDVPHLVNLIATAFDEATARKFCENFGGTIISLGRAKSRQRAPIDPIMGEAFAHWLRRTMGGCALAVPCFLTSPNVMRTFQLRSALVAGAAPAEIARQLRITKRAAQLQRQVLKRIGLMPARNE